MQSRTSASYRADAPASGLLSLRSITLALVIALTGFLAGCMNMDSSSGTPIDSAKVAKIVKGKTTRAEVEVLFGKPEMSNLLPDGRRMIAYNYTATKLGVDPATMLLGPFAKGKGSTHMQSLQIFVNKEGVVEDFEFSDNTRDIEGQGASVKSTQR